MALNVKKPEPMQVGERYIYTLTSYDPVEIELLVPYVSEYEIELAVAGIIANGHKQGEEITDEWVAEHIEGAHSIDDLRTAVRQQITEMNAMSLEEQKQSLCFNQLAERLMQSIPESEVRLMRNALKGNMMQQGLTEEQITASFGGSAEMANKILLSQAQMACEQRAALDAYASHLDLEVDEEDMPKLLGLEEKEALHFIAQAKLAGTLEQLKQNIMRNKAAQIVLEEAKCTYHHETAEEAQKRMEAQVPGGMPSQLS